MKTCAACHEDLPKDKFSKKQWKLNQRRCKVCVCDNREVQQQLPPSPAKNSKTNESSNDDVVSSLLGSVSISDQMIPVSDEELFKQPPPNEDCPICFLRLPSLWKGYKYMSCCGKVICSGCTYANDRLSVDQLCPFCRTPAPPSKQVVCLNNKRVKAGDAKAVFNLGCMYYEELHGLPQDNSKALELWQRACELGCAQAFFNLGNVYNIGSIVETNRKKAVRYWELGAMGGDLYSRFALGIEEEGAGNMERALKHYMIAVGFGSTDSLEATKDLFMKGHATKDDYAQALRAFQSYLDDIKSNQRDKAAAFDYKMYQYY